MTNPPIQFSTTGLPADYCFTSPQKFWLDGVATLLGFLPGTFSGFVKSESEPPVDQRDNLWFKLNPGGGPFGQLFMYYNGAWVWPNPEVPSSPVRRFVLCSEADVWAYDGGSGEDPAIVTPTYSGGAMWEVDDDFEWRVPMGAGTSPSTNFTLSDGTIVPFGGTVIGQGGTTGAQFVQLDETQIPDNVPTDITAGNYATGPQMSVSGGGATAGLGYFAGSGNDAGDLIVKVDGAGNPHSNIQPVKAGFFVKRTARTAYLA